MKFIHIADMHFDTPFNSLETKKGLGDARRLEQRKVFKTIIEYIKENNIEFLLISGDLYDQNYVQETTIEYINNCFLEIPNTKIIISPGNHDPYIKNSYYVQYNWAENVKIFNSTIEKLEFNNINIYGVGFNNYIMNRSQIEEVIIQDTTKTNILVTHGTLDGANDSEYHPISLSKLQQIGFDYIALGHIHKLNLKNKKIVYPGSTISLGFDEPEIHGMIEGEITKSNLEINFIKLDTREFINKEIDITDCSTELDLAEKLNELPSKTQNTNNMYKILLQGERNFEINIQNIEKLITNESIIKIKDETKTKYDYEKIAKENSLRGLFVQEMLKQKKDYEEETIEKAIEIGLNCF